MPRAAAEARAVELDEGLWRLRLPLPYPTVASANAYLLATGDGFCLVDCGTSLEPGWEALVRCLGQAGARPQDVRLLVCTHPHSDHYGLAATVVERCGCELWMAAGPLAATDALRDPAIPLERRRAAGRAAGVPAGVLDDVVGGLIGGDGHHRRIAPTRALADGDAVGSRLGRWRVLAAPGHSPTQIALFSERSRRLISGDLVVRGVPPYLEHGYTDDPHGEHLAALERALALRPALLLPGHHGPVRAAEAELAASRAATVARLERLEASLGRRSRSPYELAMRLCGGHSVPLPLRQQSLSTTLCQLDRLERTGRAVAAEEDGVRCYRAG